jgi:hypothetical protein
VAAHFNRARVADKLQLWRRKRFRNRRDEGDDNRSGRSSHGNRDNGTGGGPFFLVYMSNGIKVGVVMDSRTVLMIPVLRMIRYRVNVKPERLDL